MPWSDVCLQIKDKITCKSYIGKTPLPQEENSWAHWGLCHYDPQQTQRKHKGRCFCKALRDLLSRLYYEQSSTGLDSNQLSNHPSSGRQTESNVWNLHEPESVQFAWLRGRKSLRMALKACLKQNEVTPSKRSKKNRRRSKRFVTPIPNPNLLCERRIKKQRLANLKCTYFTPVHMTLR